MSCVGIDLGTTYSLIAHVNAHGQPALFPDRHDANQFRTPSLVYVGKEGHLVGSVVEEMMEDAPDLQPARYFKQKLSDLQWGYKDHIGRSWNATGLSGLTIKKLLGDATVFASEVIHGAVVTVPAHFTDQQRRATQAAAQMAGIQDIRLVEEPVAAACFYGMNESSRDTTILVYDFGGGTFDVTIMQVGEDGLFVLATDGIGNLGGAKINEQIVALTNDDIVRRQGRSALQDPASVNRLWKMAEETKLRLLRPGMQQIRQAMMIFDQPYEFLFTRPQLDKIALSAVDETLVACERCLKSASLEWADIDKILLTGGSSLLPQIAPRLQEISGARPADIVSRQPHQAVAFGSAILGDLWDRENSGNQRIQQVVTADLCLRVWDRKANAPGLESLIRRNVPLPASYSRVFYTNRDDQSRLVFEFVQRRGDPAEECSLGHFVFGPIQSPRKNYPVEVTVSIGNNGLVRITAKDAKTGQAIDCFLDDQENKIDHELIQQRLMVETAIINA